jgi:hypothetical protein
MRTKRRKKPAPVALPAPGRSPAATIVYGDLWPMQAVNLTVECANVRCVAFSGMVPVAEMGDTLGRLFCTAGHRIGAMRQVERNARDAGITWGPNYADTLEVRVQLTITNARNL